MVIFLCMSFFSILMPLFTPSLSCVSLYRTQEVSDFVAGVYASISGVLSEWEEDAFSEEDLSSRPWRCFSVLVLYCCYIREAMDMSTVLHGISVFRPCLPRLSTVGDILPLWSGEHRDISETKSARTYAREKDEGAAVQIARRNRGGHRLL